MFVSGRDGLYVSRSWSEIRTICLLTFLRRSPTSGGKVNWANLSGIWSFTLYRAIPLGSTTSTTQIQSSIRMVHGMGFGIGMGCSSGSAGFLWRNPHARPHGSEQWLLHTGTLALNFTVCCCGIISYYGQCEYTQEISSPFQSTCALYASGKQRKNTLPLSLLFSPGQICNLQATFQILDNYWLGHLTNHLTSRYSVLKYFHSWKVLFYCYISGSGSFSWFL